MAKTHVKKLSSFSVISIFDLWSWNC